MRNIAMLAAAVLVAASMGGITVRADDAPAAGGNGAAPGRQTAGPGDQGGRQRGNRGEMNPLARQYEQMNRELQLTDDQKPKVKAAVDAMIKELDTLRQSRMEKMRDAMKDAQAGNNGGDRGQGRRQMMQDMQKAAADYQATEAADQFKIDALLTPDQRVTWETSKLTRSLQGRFGQLALTDDQKTQVKELVDAAGKDLAAATDVAGMEAVTGKLVKKLVADVLTEEQAGKLVTAGPPMGGMGGLGGRQRGGADAGNGGAGGNGPAGKGGGGNARGPRGGKLP